MSFWYKRMVGKWLGIDSASIPPNFVEICHGKHSNVDFHDFWIIGCQILVLITHNLSAHDASWILMMHHEYSWCIMSTHDASCVLMMHQGYSWCIMSTHEASWVLLMHHEYSWCIMSNSGASWVPMMHHDYSWCIMTQATGWCSKRFVLSARAPASYVCVLYEC